MTTTVGYLTLDTVSGDTAGHAQIATDVAIVFAGWESRVLETERLDLVASQVVCVSWGEAESAPLHRTIADKLGSTAARWSSDHTPIRLHMYSDVSDGLAVLLEVLVKAYEKAGRPIRVFVDISNCPEFFTVGLFASATRLGIVAQWSFFYAEAKYDATGGTIAFTRGEWNVIPVPRLQQPIDPEIPICLVLGLGFEGEKARQLTVRYEPACLYLLLPSPGFTDEYTKRAEEENADLLRLVRESEADHPDRLLDAPAGDAAAAVAAMLSVLPQDPKANFLFVPTGPKPHALAMAAVVLSYPNATLLYRNPEKFEIRDSLNTGLSWVLTITDRSLPPSSL